MKSCAYGISARAYVKRVAGPLPGRSSELARFLTSKSGLTKPIRVDELLGAIDEALALAAAGTPAKNGGAPRGHLD